MEILWVKQMQSQPCYTLGESKCFQEETGSGMGEGPREVKSQVY